MDGHSSVPRIKKTRYKNWVKTRGQFVPWGSSLKAEKLGQLFCALLVRNIALL